MTESGYYIGEDLKFEVTLTATGFNQDCDSYTIDFYAGNKHLTFTQDDVISRGGKFYLPVPTVNLAPGMMRMVITAEIPDTDFPDGKRTEITVVNLPSLRMVL